MAAGSARNHTESRKDEAPTGIRPMKTLRLFVWFVLALACNRSLADESATHAPPANATPPAAAPVPASPAYRAVLSGLTEQNAVAVKNALLTIPNVAGVRVMPKAGFVRIDMTDLSHRLFRKQVEEALAQVPGVTVTKFFNLRAEPETPSI